MSKVNRKHTKQIALMLLSTEREFLDNKVAKCIDEYISRNPSNVWEFDLMIYFDKGNAESYKELYEYKKHDCIASVHIHIINIPDFENIYTDKFENEHGGYIDSVKDSDIRELGMSSGPNLLFYSSLHHAQSNHNHVNYMVIESDTHPVKSNWFDGLFRFSRTNNYTIGGSVYKGQLNITKDNEIYGHKNGVALYRNCEELSEILDKSKQYIRAAIKNRTHVRVNYDIAIHMITGRDYRDSIIDTDIITNISLPCDDKITEKGILSKHPKTIILHQKPSS